jgi:hypothetical protein
MCNYIKKIKCRLMKCHTSDNSTASTRFPHTVSYMVAILGRNHFESSNILGVQMESWSSWLWLFDDRRKRKRDDAFFDKCELYFASVMTVFLVEFRFLWNYDKSTAFTSKKHSLFLTMTFTVAYKTFLIKSYFWNVTKVGELWVYWMQNCNEEFQTEFKIVLITHRWDFIQIKRFCIQC